MHSINCENCYDVNAVPKLLITFRILILVKLQQILSYYVPFGWYLPAEWKHLINHSFIAFCRGCDVHRLRAHTEISKMFGIKMRVKIKVLRKLVILSVCRTVANMLSKAKRKFVRCVVKPFSVLVFARCSHMSNKSRIRQLHSTFRSY